MYSFIYPRVMDRDNGPEVMDKETGKINKGASLSNKHKDRRNLNQHPSPKKFHLLVICHHRERVILNLIPWMTFEFINVPFLFQIQILLMIAK